MVLGSTEPLIEINTRDVPGGKERSALEVCNLTAICEHHATSRKASGSISDKVIGFFN
jgi:hypothetical protein